MLQSATPFSSFNPFGPVRVQLSVACSCCQPVVAEDMQPQHAIKKLWESQMMQMILKYVPNTEICLKVS
jgi:hypothetical protein